MAQVSRDLAGAHRESDDHSVPQVERGHDCVEVSRERVVVVAYRGLAGPPEPTAVIGDNPMTAFQQGW